ncbi:MAG: acyltransferase [Variovorax sp.]|nr:MAG: acyltransferase [Variovorax sp.]
MIPQQAANHQYRPDIDGLRAVAVVSVVAFHAFPEWIKGGFVGVDIFFVISGFLISRIIFENLDRGTFSFSDFYARRIKRIFPALLLVLLACLAFGRFALLDDEFRELGKHTLAGAGFVSNLVLWKESGYFDGSADTKPLLHLWSLGIEEQFYFIWPIALWAIWKKKLNVLTVLIVIAGVSYYLNVKHVKVDPVAAFYSPQTRFWELLCGSFLAWLNLYKPTAFARTRKRVDGWLNTVVHSKAYVADGKALVNVLAFAGLLLIAYGIWKIDKNSVFPGKWAVLPVAGAVLLIAAGPSAWVNRVILSNRVAVWIGLISFPLYLWHWPLLSFARIVESEIPSMSIRAAAIVLAFVLAWLTYKLVERPLRFKVRGKGLVLVLASVMVLVGGAGYKVYSKTAIEDAQTGTLLSAAKTNCDAYFPDWTLITDNPCRLQKKTGNDIALIGDSHAGHLFVGLSELSAARGGVALYPASCAAPFLGVASAQKVKSAKEVRENAYKLMDRAYGHIFADAAVKTVVLAHQPQCSYDDAIDMTNPANTDPRKVLSDGLRRTLLALRNANKKVVIVLDNPLVPYDPKVCVSRPFRITKNNDRCSFPREEYDRMPAYAEYNAMVASVVKDFPAVKVVDLSKLLCDTKECRIAIGGKLLYSDQGHLNWDGSRYVAPYLLKEIERND